MDPAPPFLEVRGLSKWFPQGGYLPPTSFALARADRLVVMGPSGSGKTTLLRLLAGLEKPTAGIVTEEGREVNSPGHTLPPYRRSLGMVFQNLALWPHLRVREQVALALGGCRRERRLEAARALESSGLAHLAGRLPETLSAGERQRVAWLRATVARPRLLLLDEPVSSLDPRLKQQFLYLTQEYAREHRGALIWVTHDPELAGRLDARRIELPEPAPGASAPARS